VNGELGVDDHITNEDGDGVEEPAVEADHQHRRNVHLKREDRGLRPGGRGHVYTLRGRGFEPRRVSWLLVNRSFFKTGHHCEAKLLMFHIKYSFESLAKNCS